MLGGEAIPPGRNDPGRVTLALPTVHCQENTYPDTEWQMPFQAGTGPQAIRPSSPVIWVPSKESPPSSSTSAGEA